MVFNDSKHNDPQIIKNKMRHIRYCLNDPYSLIRYDLRDPAYEKAAEVFDVLKPMTAVGFNKVRLGPETDGGYVLLDMFGRGKSKVAYSFGISNADPFSLDMTERGYDVWQYDGTIKNPPHNHPKIHFNRLNISGEENPKPGETNLRRIIQENAHTGETDIILKCDIEGGEWPMLETARGEDLMKFSQISMEIHNINIDDKLPARIKLLKKLNETHQPVHIHANNHDCGTVLKNFRILPVTLELTYARKDICGFTECKEEFPTVLDFPCVPDMPDIFIGSFNPPQKSCEKEDQYSNILAEISANFYDLYKAIGKDVKLPRY